VPLPRATPPKSHRRWASRSLLIRLRRPGPLRQTASRRSDARTRTTGTEPLPDVPAVMRRSPMGRRPPGRLGPQRAAPAQSVSIRCLASEQALGACEVASLFRSKYLICLAKKLPAGRAPPQHRAARTARGLPLGAIAPVVAAFSRCTLFFAKEPAFSRSVSAQRRLGARLVPCHIAPLPNRRALTTAPLPSSIG
jgi:hypothetical protein